MLKFVEYIGDGTPKLPGSLTMNVIVEFPRDSVLPKKRIKTSVQFSLMATVDAVMPVESNCGNSPA